ncbi:LysM peptidoglycan-binding domain-containing protein [Flavonifractor sp. An100]|uniref:LysM peptidoglycan-binding domain-containing protein n=1 Tax=Flavonifractor sp. An100 TaxID=1965538 RepID=UPI000B39245C|nr:LysM peptidoglycan-binding domain-containing protein [Flavonifractor sp. An100]OUQ80162.1 glycoside hydrolase [Flavonifractor sp. An100]
MLIHVVRPGDTMYSVALQYGVPMSQLIQDNQLPDPSRLVVGQTLVIQYPKKTYTVCSGDTLTSIAKANGTTVRSLMQNNSWLQGNDLIFPGQRLVISYQQEKQGTISVNGYAYPNIDSRLLRSSLPYLTDLTPFTYTFTPQGALVSLQDQTMVDAALQTAVQPLLHLSTFSDEHGFSSELAHIVLTDPAVQSVLVAELLELLPKKGYRGLDVDFEYLYPSDAPLYAQFISRLRDTFSPLGIPVIVALVPKVFAEQPGTLYEGHDYQLLGQAADFVLLMTYEWGYTEGPPMAVAPIRNVRQVLDYAVTVIKPEKIFLGIPNYGYDWKVPFRQGSKAKSISNPEAVELAARSYSAIRFDEKAQAPWFRYVDGSGQEHEVWFEDARSIQAKLALTQEYGLFGVSYWNLMRPFPQNWLVLNSLYEIR